MHTRDIDYAGGDARLRGYLAFKDSGARRWSSARALGLATSRWSGRADWPSMRRSWVAMQGLFDEVLA